MTNKMFPKNMATGTVRRHGIPQGWGMSVVVCPT